MLQTKQRLSQPTAGVVQRVAAAAELLVAAERPRSKLSMQEQLVPSGPYHTLSDARQDGHTVQAVLDAAVAAAATLVLTQGIHAILGEQPVLVVNGPLTIWSPTKGKAALSGGVDEKGVEVPAALDVTGRRIVVRDSGAPVPPTICLRCHRPGSYELNDKRKTVSLGTALRVAGTSRDASVQWPPAGAATFSTTGDGRLLDGRHV